MEKLSDLLKSYRKMYALTQRDLAVILGTSTVTVSNIENNKITAGHRVVKAIALATNYDILEVVKLNENNKSL